MILMLVDWLFFIGVLISLSDLFGHSILVSLWTLFSFFITFPLFLFIVRVVIYVLFFRGLISSIFFSELTDIGHRICYTNYLFALLPLNFYDLLSIC